MDPSLEHGEEDCSPAHQQRRTRSVPDFDRRSHNGLPAGTGPVRNPAMLLRNARTPAENWETRKALRRAPAADDVRDLRIDLACAIGVLTTPKFARDDASECIKQNGKINYSGLVTRLAGASDKTMKKRCDFLKEKMEEILQELPLNERLEKQVEAVRELGRQLTARPNDRGLLRQLAFGALTIARITVNTSVINGMSLSELPAERNLEEDEQVALEALCRIGKSTSVAEPLREFALALSQFRRGGSDYALGVRAAVVAVAILGDALPGWLAQLQAAYFLYPMFGTYEWAAALRRVRRGARRLDAAKEDAVLAEFPDLQLLSTGSLVFATLLNEASALAGLLASGGSANPSRDYRRIKRLVRMAKAVAEPGDAAACLLLEAELVAVGEMMRDAGCGAKEFWHAMTADKVEELLTEVRDREEWGALVNLVERSAHAHANVAPR